MATKFSSIYKQELKSRGAIESLGSTVVKSIGERADLRNVLFGGKGFISSSGRKIFGRGYDPINKAKRITPDSSAAVSSLTESNRRQEDALRIIVKNTMNMNMMARDMNITRQNIATLTKSVTGKSSKGADALWMSSEKRNAIAGQNSPIKEGSSKSIMSSVLGGFMGIGGTAGSVIFRTLGSIIAIAPIMGIVGIAAAGYAIKKMTEDMNFKGFLDSIKNNILEFLGVDPNSDEPILKQLMGNLGKLFGAEEKFKSIYDWIDNTFKEDFKKIKDTVQEGSKIVLAYSKAAFITLGENFAKVGDIFGFHFQQFINQYKPEMLATLGASIGGSVGSLFGIKGAALGALVGGGAMYILGKLTQTRGLDQIESDIKSTQQDIGVAETRIENALKEYKIVNGKKEAVGYLNQRQQKSAEEDLTRLQDRMSGLVEEREVYNARIASMRLSPENFPGGSNFRLNLENALRQQGLTSNPRSPEKVSELNLTDSQRRYAQMIYDEFYKEFKSDTIARAAVANAYEESRLVPNAKNLTGENSRGLFQINLNDEANRAFLQKEYGTRMFDALLDPKTNIEAMIKLMKTAPGNITKLKQEGTVEGATRRMMLDFLRPRDQSEPAQMKRVGNLTVANRLLDGSVDLDNARRYAASSGATAGTTIINNNNNNVGSTGTSRSTGAYNVDAAELFFGPLVRGFN